VCKQWRFVIFDVSQLIDMPCDIVPHCSDVSVDGVLGVRHHRE
jgi:hypothetical protein